MGNLTAAEILNAKTTRKELAAEMGISYQHLCNRMCGFSPWPEEELKRARHILAAFKRKNTSATCQPAKTD
jgi:hypothetical protein